MSAENLTPSREASKLREAVVAVATTALTFPAALDRGMIAAVIEALRPDDNNYDLCRLALPAFAAIVYSRPNLVDFAMIDRLAELASIEALPGDIASMVVRLFAFLASSAAAEQAWTRLRSVLLDQRISPKIRARLLQLVGDFVRRRQELVGLDGILELAETMQLPAHRAFLLDHGVEPFVFCTPEVFDEPRLERIATLFENTPRYRYVLRFLAARRSLSPDIQATLSRRLEGRFPLSDAAAAILIGRPVKLLVVMNINIGQGDEIVRLAPLLQALLDANPALTIALIARRTYLYENPRVQTVSIKDDGAVEAAMAGSFEGVIEIFQPDRPDWAFRKDLHSAVEHLIAECRPAFIIRAELGRAQKGDLAIRSEFLYESVELAGREVAQSSGLNQRASGNIYETCMRLLAEFGLPQRVAEEAPLSASILIGVRSPETERLWSGLVEQDSSVPARPTVLVNPFGGASSTKGFFEQDQLLAAEIGGLVDEGYLVVMLPNGTPWGRREAIVSVLSHLDAQTRAFVRVAPDPAETSGAAMLELSERPDLAYADNVMRMFKYFATYADLVVTVEGWLSHLAYNLARPFRLFLANGSFTPEWFPYGRGPRQRIVTALSPRCRVSHSESGLLRKGEAPPLPHGPRKQMLELAMSGLGGSEGIAALRHALTSRDGDIRRHALAALARIAPSETKPELLDALHGCSPGIGRAAAQALLAANVDCGRELGPRYRELLQIELDIIDHKWEAVTAAGAAAFPGLFRAANCDSYVLAMEARAFLRQALRPYAGASIDALSNNGKRKPPSTREALVDVLRTALTKPDQLTNASLAPFAEALRDKPNGDDPDLCELALASVAALLYSRPDLVDASLIERLPELLGTSGLRESIGRVVVKLFAFLTVTPHASHAWDRISEMLRNDHLDAATREWMLPLVSDFIQWREDVVGLEGIITLAQSPTLSGKRTYLFDEGVERFVFCDPQGFTIERLQKIASFFSDAPRYAYVLYALAGQQSLAPEVSLWLTRELDGRFPFHARAAAILKDRPVSLFVALNVGMGQGDDVVRLVPLLHGLLDANPALSIALATWRPYLYDNPRITTVQITDDAAVNAALAGWFDGVIEFFQPEWLDFTFRLEAHAAVEDYLAKHQPALLIRGDLGRKCEGRVGSRLAFLFQTVDLGKDAVAGLRGLDDCSIRNVYEPTMRLLAELGLPLRTAEATPLTPSVLTGTPSADAERIWAELTAQESTTERLPIALVNPFGGSGVTKGFLAQDALIAEEIAGLVDEGFMVVVLPNGQTWGRRTAIDGIVAHLDAGVRANVRVAPDPAETDEAARPAFSERTNLAYNDRVMRAFKYFAEYADLVVTTEGWLAHLAYNLGKPMRLFLAAGSYSSEYHPRFRGPRQRVVPVLSEGARAAHSGSALLREGDPPPIPHRPRKALLEVALNGLGRFGAGRDATAFRLSLTSDDPEVRTWAVAALGRVAAKDAKAELLAALKDRWAGVFSEAAQALIRENVDCTRELGARYRELLQGYVDIAKQNWDEVARLGPMVLPALFNAAECDIHDVKHGAKELARKMVSPFVRDL
jgi:hypothetical protein